MNLRGDSFLLFLFFSVFSLKGVSFAEYSLFVTERYFVCGLEEKFYVIPLSHGYKYDLNISFWGTSYRKIGYALWEVEFSEKLNAIYPDGSSEEITTDVLCPQKLNAEIKISSFGRETATIDVLLSGNLNKFDETRVFVSLGKIRKVVRRRDGNLSIFYTRKFSTPYNDFILILAERKVRKKTVTKIFFSEIKIPSRLKFSGKTEPGADVKLIIGKRTYKTVSGKNGRFVIWFDVMPGERNFKVVLIDKFGNRSEKEIKIPRYPLPEPESISFLRKWGNKIFVFIPRGKLGFHVFDMRGKKLISGAISSDDMEKHNKFDFFSIFTIFNGVFIISPEYGYTYHFYLIGTESRFQLPHEMLREITFSVRKIPYEIDVEDYMDTIYADGTSSSKIAIKLLDIFGDPITLPSTNFRYEVSFGEIKMLRWNEFEFRAERMPYEVPEFPVKITFVFSFVKKEIEIMLKPGRPHDIQIWADKKSVRGDKEDKLTIHVRVIDMAGNTIFVKPEVYVSAGKIQEEMYHRKKNKGEFTFSYSVEKDTNSVEKIVFSVGNIRKAFHVIVEVSEVVKEIFLSSGISTNLGRVFFTGELGGNILMRKVDINPLFGIKVKVGFLRSKIFTMNSYYSGALGGLQIGRIYLSRFTFISLRFGSVIYLGIHSIKRELGGGLEISSAPLSFSAEPFFSASTRITKKLNLNFLISYIFHFMKPETYFIRIEEGIDFITLSISLSFRL